LILVVLPHTVDLELAMRLSLLAGAGALPCIVAGPFNCELGTFFGAPLSERLPVGFTVCPLLHVHDD